MCRKNLFKALAITLTAANIMSAAPATVLADDGATQAVEATTEESPTEESPTEESLASLSADNSLSLQQETAPVAVAEEAQTANSIEIPVSEETSTTDNSTPTEEKTESSADSSSADSSGTDSSGADSSGSDSSDTSSESTPTEEEKQKEESKEESTESKNTESKEEKKEESSSSSGADSKKEESNKNAIDTTKSSSSTPATYNVHSSSRSTVHVTSITKENTPNAYKAACLLVEKGFTKEAAAGILGNFFCESGGQGSSDINPADDNGNAIGIAQWTGSGRRAFLSWCNNNDRQWDSIETQVDYLISNIQSRWSYASQIGSVKALTNYGLGSKLHLDFESFKSCESVEEATLSFLGVYEDDLYARTARWAGFSSLTAWIEYETTNRLKCASDSYVAFFDGTALDISYESQDLRSSYTKVEKDGFIIRNEGASIYTDTDKTEVAGTIAKYAVVYKLAEKDGMLYIESGDVRGFIEGKDLYSDKKSKALIEKLGNEAFKEAESKITLDKNKALDFTKTTVYWFRNPSDEEFVNYATSVAEKSTNNASWIKDTCSFFNVNVNLSENFDKVGTKASKIKEGTVVSYKDGEDTVFAIAQDEENFLTVNSAGQKATIKDIEVIEARNIFADTEYTEMINDVPYYCQGDFRDVRYNDGSVASDGCGITSFSMVASYFLNKQISPAQSAVWAMENGANTVTNWGAYKILADHYGITLEGQYTGPYWGGSSEEIVNALKEGKIVIGSMQGGYFNPSGRGHYIVYTGIDDEGHIYVNDPGSRARTTAGSYSQNDAFKECKQFWIFSK